MSRAIYEERLETALTDLAVLAAARNTNPGDSDSFCVSYLIPLVDFAAAPTQVYVPTLTGYKTELKSFLTYDANSGTVEVFSSAETVDAGDDADPNAIFDGAVFAIPVDEAGDAAAAGSTRLPLTANLGTISPALVQENLAAVVTGIGFAMTSVSTTGIIDVLVTVRYFK